METEGLGFYFSVNSNIAVAPISDWGLTAESSAKSKWFQLLTTRNPVNCSSSFPLIYLPSCSQPPIVHCPNWWTWCCDQHQGFVISILTAALLSSCIMPMKYLKPKLKEDGESVSEAAGLGSPSPFLFLPPALCDVTVSSHLHINSINVIVMCRQPVWCMLGSQWPLLLSSRC